MKQSDIVLRLIECSIDELPTKEQELAHRAIEMTNNAYTPYSHFSVGAAILLENGVIVAGANQENVAFPSGTCAERSACFYAGANYPDSRFVTIAVAAREGDSKELVEKPISPCGGCRQALLEYEMIAGRPVKVILIGRKNVLVLPSVASLLPLAFTSF